MPENLRITGMDVKDAGGAAVLEAECFRDAWTEDSMRATIEGRASYCLKAELDGELVGYCSTQIVLDEGEILRIAVSPKARRMGIGRRLLEEITGRNPQVVIWNLDVREHNEAARGLYSGFGFIEIGRRKKYYHQPEEDAILMQRA